ncbi:MBL fold metallo-hydrolase [Ruegeria arenilitoris]|uniref:MBL fold metallo-hydrolase n=1 Tax=Ruegeria arenilitoris TaxID=1173585 RepID=UPI001480EEC5|nr:MBL fold metallo-hydrolase [Ruegeria arenilitoris]
MHSILAGIRALTTTVPLWFGLPLDAQTQFDTSPMGGGPFGHSVKHIGSDIYVFRWWVYRNFFIVTDEGVIATDPLNPDAAGLLKQEIKKVTDKPIRYVIYSHYHHDHISGGVALDGEGVTFVAHENVAKQLQDHPNPTLPEPDITFSDTYTVELGERHVELEYYGPNHSDSLVIMRLPEEKIIFVVDIVTPRRVAFRGMPDFWPDEWVRTLKEIEATDYDYVISGHGPETEPAIEPAAVVSEQREYIEDLMAAVKAEMDAGTHSPDQLRQNVTLPKYQDWRAYDDWLPMNIERIWAYYHMGW